MSGCLYQRLRGREKGEEVVYLSSKLVRRATKRERPSKDPAERQTCRDKVEQGNDSVTETKKL